MRDAEVARLTRLSLGRGRDILEELDPVPVAGESQVRHAHVCVRVADDGGEVAAALLLLEDDLHPEGVAVEGDGPLEIADGETRVRESRHQKVMVTPPSTVTTCPVR